MRSDVSVQELIVPGELEAAFERVCETSGEFTEACVALGLDPTRDFCFSNLQGVDFSGADLRGFDFQGANLRGSYGAEVLFDMGALRLIRRRQSVADLLALENV